MEKEVDDFKKNVYERCDLHIRLNNIFTHLSQETSLDIPSFYTDYEKNYDNPSLFFTFDAGIDPDPYFSSILDGKLFIDKKNLILEIFPKDKKRDSRKEILIKNINTIEYKFLSYDPGNSSEIKEKVTDIFNWYHLWPKEKKTNPAIIYIKINNKFDFVFFLETNLF
jgi:hypothetical protein